MKSGLYVVGRLKGIATQKWFNGQGEDTLLCVAISFADKYGEIKESDFEIKVYPDEIARVVNFDASNRGKEVVVGYSEFRRQSKDKTKNWVEHHFNRNCQLYLAPKEN